MKFTLAIAALSAIASVTSLSIPQVDQARVLKRNLFENLAKRQSVTSGVDDVTILNFALTLEHLEATFYAQALEKFDQNCFDEKGYYGLRPLLQQVAMDEAEHVTFLTTALKAAGAPAVSACNYTFPYTDVPDFLALAQAVENVGVSAYLGAAAAINESAYLTAAGSILTVEARHNAFFRLINHYTPFPQPFDTPLDARSVVTIVSPFFKSCPSGSAPTIPGFPALTVSSTNNHIGSQLSIAPTNASAVNTQGTVYCGFASGLSTGFSTWSNGKCQIPTQNVTEQGQSYVWLTKGPSVADASVLAGPAIIDTSYQNVSVSIPALKSSN
ncbi:hypothetical protein BMF94_0596 [Rhodotorula taiwanensis]|uniref:Uncharacterized protein n=1 Tax=Rhodotorula taiwanensis TaxID=741276 RepID=A0A2S5BHZ3_9BASI|nr:hypothetical protein BMF94_0596 [Rhodotorula taiwanensis]